MYNTENYTVHDLDSYVNAFTVMKITCPEGHRGESRVNDFQQGRRCMECSGKMKKTTEELLASFAEHDYILHNANEYIDSHTSNLIYTCPELHQGKTSWSNFNGGTRCPRCKNKSEAKVFGCVNSEYETDFQFTSELCPGKKFDMFVVKFNVIIEVDGEQHFRQVSNWQSPEITRANDIYKMKCVQDVHRIIRIDRRVIDNNNDDWKDNLRDAIKSSEKIIYISNDPELYNEHKKDFNLK